MYLLIIKFSIGVNMRAFLAVMFLVVLAGCNQVKAGFRPLTTAENLKTSPNVERFDGEPTIRDSADPENEFAALRRAGWLALGWTAYVDDMTADQQLRNLAREYQAELVTRFHLGTRSSSTVMPISTGTGMMYMPSYSSTTNYGAMLWARFKRISLGIYGRNLTEEEAIKRSNANGAYVQLLIRGGAAERAGIKEGDIISGVGGRDIVSVIDMFRSYEQVRAESIDFRIERNGESLMFPVTKDLAQE
ncbi:PDZ domain-containing protein [Ferrovibrio sp.]|uniref:PDZ domain-containing protein n=1 Tax=Ferrovibrio sp. TaxID=1917215 RepID=UPI0035AEB42D